MTVFFLTSGNDTFPGVGQINSGNDVIFGGLGNDSIRGGLGNDAINGDAGADSLFGEEGNDSLYGGFQSGAELLDGSVGFDLAVLSFDDVLGAGGQSVRVSATFSTVSFVVFVDGIANSTVQFCEQFQIDSGNANDSITGGTQADIIQSLGGNDTLNGGAGNDFISKTWGTYNLDGGAGNDRLSVSNTHNNLPFDTGLLFDARLAIGTISSGGITTGTFRRFESYSVSGTTLDDTVHGAGGNDDMSGLTGNDLIFGYGGNDLLDGGLGDDFIDGGAGNDTLRAGAVALAGADTVIGGNGDDVIIISTQGFQSPRTFLNADFLGGNGTDVLQIQALDGDYDLTGASLSGIESLQVTGNALVTVLLTSAQVNAMTNFVGSTPSGSEVFIELTDVGNVVLDGVISTIFFLAGGGQRFDASAATYTHPSSSAIQGGAGNDVIIGAAQSGIWLGNGGNDRIISTNATGVADILRGGAGNDTLTGSAVANQLEGYQDNDLLNGEGGNDTLLGFDGQDTVNGGDGNDSATGDGGDDRIGGDAGDDTLSGGLGRDRLTGGTGVDHFVFDTIAESGTTAALADIITDFVADPLALPGFIETIDLSGIAASAPPGVVYSFIGTAAFTAAGQVRVSQSGVDTLVEVNAVGAGTADMVIRLQNVLATDMIEANFVFSVI